MSRFYALELYAPVIKGSVTQSRSVTVYFPSNQSSVLPGKSVRTVTTPQSVTYPSATKVWTSHPNGIYDPGAQNIAFDVLTYGLGQGDNIFAITLEGVSYQDIKQHNNFRDYGLRLYAGMLPGLPLADNQPTPGLIVQGYVIEGIGNWVGNDMTLTFIVNPDQFSEKNPGNLIFTWKPGQTLAQALQSMISLAYPGVTFTAEIDQNLATSHTVTHRAANLSDFAQWLKQYTQYELGSDYPGVEIYFTPGKIVASDGTQSANKSPLTIAFDDLIGQPVWSDASQMDVTVAMRADVKLGQMIQLPYTVAAPGLQVELPSLTNASLNYETSFKGAFQVQHTRQLGDLRSDDGAAWATVIRCYAGKVA